MEKLIGYDIVELGPTGGCHSITKIFPTWLGAKRVLNRIKKEHISLVGYKYKLRPIYR